MKKILSEARKMQRLAGIIKEAVSDFNIEELDDFLVNNSFGSEEEIQNVLPAWTGGSLEDDGYEVATALDGLQKGYSLKTLWIIETTGENNQGNGLVKVEEIVPKDTKEKTPEVYLATLFFSTYGDLDWNKVLPKIQKINTQGYKQALDAQHIMSIPGIGGNSFILPKKYEAALETMVQGGAAGDI